MDFSRWRRRIIALVPKHLRARLRRAQARRFAQRPLAETFTEAYRSGRWGGAGPGVGFHSGSGSRGAAATEYGRVIKELIGEVGARTVVDLGCGDFTVASGFVGSVDRYIGVDVVPDVVADDTLRFADDHVSFQCLDATRDELPAGDMCLIRQVFQHLSNQEIADILVTCRQYRVVVITEHVASPARAPVPNRDKPHGWDTRILDDSWVDIRQAPFGCMGVEELLAAPAETWLKDPGETIRTFIWRPRDTESKT